MNIKLQGLKRGKFISYKKVLSLFIEYVRLIKGKCRPAHIFLGSSWICTIAQ